jgi:hypothetical protein
LYFKRYKAGGLLLALFIIMLAGAFLLYPRRSAVHQLGTPFLNINTTGTVEILNTELKSAASRSGTTNSYDLLIDLEVSNPTKTVTPPTSNIEIPLPAYITADCGQASGLANCKFQPGQRGQLTAQAIFGSAQLYNGRRVWPDYNIDIPFSGPWSQCEANGLDIECQLPIISIGSLSEPPGYTSQASATGNLKVEMLDYISDPTSYDWTGGPAPLPVASEGRSPGYLEWIEPLSALSGPDPVSGTNHSAAEWDNFRTFAAGALVGIAGGALVGAIQESTHREDKVGSAPNR